MRIKGLEPSLLSEPEPKSGASANFAISAFRHLTIITHNKAICQHSETRSFVDTGFTDESSPQQFSLFLTPHLALTDRLPGNFVHHAVSRQTLILLKALDSRSSASAKNTVDRARIVTLHFQTHL